MTIMIPLECSGDVILDLDSQSALKGSLVLSLTGTIKLTPDDTNRIIGGFLKSVQRRKICVHIIQITTAKIPHISCEAVRVVDDETVCLIRLDQREIHKDGYCMALDDSACQKSIAFFERRKSGLIFARAAAIAAAAAVTAALRAVGAADALGAPLLGADDVPDHKTQYRDNHADQNKVNRFHRQFTFCLENIRQRAAYPCG